MSEHEQQNAAQQAWDWKTKGTVHEQVIREKGLRKKLTKYVTASLEQKTRSPYTHGTTGAAKVARFMGKDNLATWIDRLFLSADKIDKPRRPPPLKKEKEKGETKAHPLDYSARAGYIVGISKNVRAIHALAIENAAVVSDMARDVRHIKSLIMPRKMVVRGKPIVDDWGRTDDSATGRIELAHYNPLAPAGAQFVKSKKHRPKGWRKGLYVQGRPTSQPLGKEFIQSAIQQAAMETAIITLKIEKEDAKKAELHKKRTYVDPKESDARVQVDPMLIFAAKANKHFKTIEDDLDILKEKSDDKDDSWWIIPPGSALGKFLSWAKTILIGVGRFLPYAVGALGAIEATLAIFGSINKGMQQAADTGIDKVISDQRKAVAAGDTTAIPKAIEQSLMQAEDKLARAQKSGNVAAIEQAQLELDYNKQRMMTSDKLTEEERKAAKDYLDKRAAGITPKQIRDLEREVITRASLMKKTNTRKEVDDYLNLWDVYSKKLSSGEEKDATISGFHKWVTAQGGVVPAKIVLPELKPPPAAPAIGGTEEEKKKIKANEGFKPKPYQDSLGKWTIGYGHLIGTGPDNKTLPKEWEGKELSQTEGDALFEKDYAEHRAAAQKNVPGFDKLNARGQSALTDLTFNMGPNWVKEKGFKQFEKAMSQPVPDVDKAADSLVNSKWYKQVKTRGPKIVRDLRSGLDPVPTGGPALASVSPVSTRPNAGSMDRDSKTLMASNTPQGSGTSVVAPVSLTNVNQTKAPPTRPIATASSLATDPSFVRGSTPLHPVSVG